ncbi:MAG: putative lipopolysaccharide heptosyltransferase III [Verrucomicrobia bacterium]|nr:putative lipopolysaccharide heptosyltransferase III [Verrucomicrobiota bacterium]
MTYGDYPDLKSVKKILVVKLRHLGDVLLTGPVFGALKGAMPQATIDAFIWSESVPMLEGHPAIDGFVEYDRGWKKLGLKRFIQEWKLLRKIRRGGYDLVINLTEGDRGAMAAKISGAKIRVGFDPKGSGLWGKKGLYTHVVKSCPGLRHTVERNLDAVRRIGIFPTLEERDLSLRVPDEAMRSVEKRIGTAPFVLIHPTSRWRFKCWPADRMRALAKKLIERGERLVFTSGPDRLEVEMVQEIVKGLPAVNLAGQISLKELAALIQKSKALICVDSVPMHMASALKAPVVAIFGPTSDVTWGPWRNSRSRVVAQKLSCRPCYQDGCGGSKMSDCLHTLSVAQVLSAFDSLYDGSVENCDDREVGENVEKPGRCKALGLVP